MTMKTKRFGAGVTMVLALTLLAIPAVPAAAQDDLPMNIHAIVARASGVGQGRTNMLDIRINAWTTDEEAQPLYDAIKAGNQHEIEQALQKLKPVGEANTAGSMGLSLRIARYFKTADGGSNIILATDRPISIGEEMLGGQSTKFNTSLIVLDIPASGTGGEGYLAAAVMLTIGESGKIEPNDMGQGVTKLAEVEIKEGKHH